MQSCSRCLGAAIGSPYIIFILHPSYGFMLEIYVYTRILKISIKNSKGFRNVRKSIETNSEFLVLGPITSSARDLGLLL